MFTPKMRKITVTRIELVIPNGSTRKDFYDAAWKADQMVSDDGDAQKLHDDSWQIEARDEETVIYWTEEEQV